MNKFITCEHCKADLLLEDVLQERQIRENLYEVGLQCPCGVWTHSFFTSTELKMLAARAAEQLQKYQDKKTPLTWKQYETARDAYKVRFEKFNHRWRRKLGMLR